MKHREGVRVLPFSASIGAIYYSSVPAAGLILSWLVSGFAIPTLLRTNNKAHQYAPSAPDALIARRCAGRYVQPRSDQ